MWGESSRLGVCDGADLDFLVQLLGAVKTSVTCTVPCVIHP